MRKPRETNSRESYTDISQTSLCPETGRRVSSQCLQWISFSRTESSSSSRFVRHKNSRHSCFSHSWLEEDSCLDPCLSSHVSLLKKHRRKTGGTLLRRKEGIVIILSSFKQSMTRQAWTSHFSPSLSLLHQYCCSQFLSKKRTTTTPMSVSVLFFVHFMLLHSLP